MERGNEENNHKTSSPSSTQLLRCREISTGEKCVDVNIPLDLKVEILKKLPAKSLLRFQCVSKEWLSIISSRRDFIDSIVTRSLTQSPPRDIKLIFHHQVDTGPNFFIFSSTYPQNTDKESLTTRAGSYHYVRGLICCWLDFPTTVDIYNPTTRQYYTVPDTNRYQYIDTCFFGYDPLENQYKVMVLPKYDMEEKPCQVFTVGDPMEKPWRDIPGIGLHFPLEHAVCINGFIYYRASNKHRGSTFFLVSFDVRSEKFNHVKAPEILMDHPCTLINYQGKLGFMCCKKGVEIWVMEDAKRKQEWSKIIFYKMEGLEKWRIAGVTHGGEIVFINGMLKTYDRLYVFYYDPKRNSMRDVEVEGTMVKDIEGERKHYLRVWVVPNLVENTMRL
ncbi:unnamed protein product [Arabidopsis lyrata]|uniref:putative F-box protein At1g32420 n=1 Tax=Arabidopsis lyrata subsp. lyrata TaxID=81972 RepID=UPI000A29C966|nr:putative F-box protein At1g32420 [Arabidopsis lyrata subsp. lyrata]CAH8254342.1 unnamed protein product [Arabidopsis lyrata]|eukprot:XP_020866446.1 putative F-box protein At1g32420 [Arabidopsis lyrata subsp. lyrata]